MATDIGFIPTIFVGEKIGVIAPLKPEIGYSGRNVYEILTFAGASFTLRERTHIILESTIPFEKDSTLEQLFSTEEKLTFKVLKARENKVLAPFQHPHPYTDDWLVLLSLDDMMTLFLSV